MLLTSFVDLTRFTWNPVPAGHEPLKDFRDQVSDQVGEMTRGQGTYDGYVRVADPAAVDWFAMRVTGELERNAAF